MNRYLILLSTILLCACSNSPDELPLFQKIAPKTSGVLFANTLTETDTLNYFNYGYIYMGGGVSVADFNGDGIKDLYFTGNMVTNKLYLGNGDLTYRNVTEKSGVGGDHSWMQGTTVCDINEDGRPDLYVSVSGKSKVCQNLLFVNIKNDTDGTPLFEEQAATYGIADPGHSTNSVFFDYDNDGDLDLYVINYPITNFEMPAFFYSQMIRNPQMRHSDHLYRNEGNGKFTNVTEEAGLLSHGLSLGIGVCDFNRDGYQDLYVSNDFASSDQLYLNNADGTFSEISRKATRQTSYYGMGIDIADINNDGLMDIFQLDMAPEDNRRIKENMAGMNPEAFYEMTSLGLHHQYMYNALQLNRGLSKENHPVFSNIAWLGGVSSTDWSWSPLMADFDNDGWKDLFITNGTRRDINNNDFFRKLKDGKGTYFSKPEQQTDQLANVQTMPSEAIANYAFRNEKNLTFSNQTKSWGLDEKTFSNGATYSDLDNDGDLDLIINNIDGVASIYQNNAQNNWISFSFSGPSSNKMGLGTRVSLWSNGQLQVAELTLTRGFQSSTDPSLTFGLGSSLKVDSVRITWPSGAEDLLTNPQVNHAHPIRFTRKEKRTQKDITHSSSAPLFTEVVPEKPYQHKENEFNDFDFQVLLPHKLSAFGPALATADINGDGLDDLYVGAAAGANGKIGLQTQSGAFEWVEFQSQEDLPYEDIDAVFADFDKDQDMDLYLVSGGNEYPEGNVYYQDRLFLNEDGSFIRTEALPDIPTSGSCVRPYDWDQDGDLDLFVGSRHTPRNYPSAASSWLLRNDLTDGKLSFSNVTDAFAPQMSSLGMVTDALWTDADTDGSIDLMIVGEWMPVTLYQWTNDQLVPSEDFLGQQTTGWWFSIEQGDFNQDGKPDYLIGNLGTNYKYQARKEAPFRLYADDFDQNGKKDIVLSYHNFGNEYPLRGRQCSSEQIPAIKEKYKDYQSFSVATMNEIFGEHALDNSLSFEIASFKSIYLSNKGNGNFDMYPLPNEAQLSPINDILIDDYDGDGHLDAIIAGNLYASEVETPRADAGIGLLLKGNGQGEFIPMSMTESGIYLPFDTKKLAAITLSGEKGVLAANNNGPLRVFQRSR